MSTSNLIKTHIKIKQSKIISISFYHFLKINRSIFQED